MFSACLFKLNIFCKKFLVAEHDEQETEENIICPKPAASCFKMYRNRKTRRSRDDLLKFKPRIRFSVFEPGCWCRRARLMYRAFPRQPPLGFTDYEQQHSDRRVTIWHKQHDCMDPSFVALTAQAAAGVMVWGISSLSQYTPPPHFITM